MKTKRKAQLLAMLGFSTAATSCEALNEIGGGGAVCMYGQPSAAYVFNTEVVDEDGKPIKGIEVSTPVEHPYGVSDITTALTGEDGKCVLDFKTWPTGEFKVSATDVDGAENGGEFEAANAFVLIDSKDYKNPGEHGWHKGKATKRVKFQLNHKE